MQDNHLPPPLIDEERAAPRTQDVLEGASFGNRAQRRAALAYLRKTYGKKSKSAKRALRSA